MPLADRNIVITPNRGSSSEPQIRFTGADTATSATIVLKIYNSSTVGQLSIEGNAGQLFSIVDSLSGSLFSVNDVSGLPSIEVFDTGEVRFAQFSGYVNIANTASATSTATGALRVQGGVGIGGDLYARNIYSSGTLLGASSTTATQVQTAAINSNSNYFITFVDSNNAVATNETVYTTSSFTYNPNTGRMTVGATTGTSSHIINLATDNSNGIVLTGKNNAVGNASADLLIQRTTSTAGIGQGPCILLRASTDVVNNIGSLIQGHSNITQFFRYTTSWNESMRIDGSGNVGIGTSVPIAVLEIAGTTRITGITTVTNTTNATSTITGALQIAGGAGIGRDLWVGGTVQDSKGEIRTLVVNSTGTAYTLVAADHGKTVSSTANITIPASVFSAGQVITIFNNSASPFSISTASGGLVMYLAGSSTVGNRTLAQRGLCTVLCIASNTFVISGAGVS